MMTLYRAEAAAALAELDALERKMARLLRENERLRTEIAQLRERQLRESSELRAHEDELVA